jgi:hypothetical protein
MMAAVVLMSCSQSETDTAQRPADAPTSPSQKTNKAAPLKAPDAKMPLPSNVATEVEMQEAAQARRGPTEKKAPGDNERAQPAQPPKLPPPPGATPLSPDFDVWIDPKQKAVIVDGQISLREGLLEMFACLRNTKEHESIISVNTRAFLVHAGLIQLGAEPGSPVQFLPEYRPPKGTEIEITVQWRDEAGKEQSVRAQEMIKDLRTEKPMTHPFVFAGSLFWKDPETGKEYYMAESGDFICVSNFATAMLDIPVPSSQSNEQLGFLAFSERIPPLGTPVRLILKPKLKQEDERQIDKTTADSPATKKN